jgi:hypothetical protein
MNFDNAQQVQEICWSLRTGDYPRGRNRARINQLFNGVAPYSETEVTENNIAINVNFLEGTRIAHDARTQFYGAFLKPGNYFKATTDMGPGHKQQARSVIVTKEMNRIMKRSLDYYECFRSKFANDVLHGIAPSAWQDGDSWCPEARGVEDLLVPADTNLTFRNLPLFCFLKSFTVPEMIRLTQRTKVDPAWNMDLVERCIKQVDKESMALLGQNWPEVWSPEKVEERVKSDGGFYMGDRVPTIDVFDFWYWNDAGKDQGWRRRIVLDNWSNPETGGSPSFNSDRTANKDDWLYNPGQRKVASSHREIFSCQFADLSSVAPFRYHSVRSLGYLMYAVCHLQNRLRCKFIESVFEQLMMLFRTTSENDVQKALKVDLFNRGFVDESVQFIPAKDRYQVNAGLAELGLKEIGGLISQNSSSFSTTPANQQDRTEKTKFQVMAEVQQATALVSAALQQAYAYQTFEYREIFRRFCKPRSRDPEVLKFRAACLRQGVPANMLNVEAWDIEPERVMGAGNKTLELAIAQQLMQYRNLFDPEPQREILRDVTLAVTDDPARADRLVPEKPVAITDSVHDAQISAATLLRGLPVGIKTGINHIEYVQAMLPDMAIIIGQIMKKGGVSDPDTIAGLQNMAQHISQHIAIIGQDPEQKQLTKQFGDALGKLMNQVKAISQRTQEAMQKQQQSNGSKLDPKDAAKIQGQMLQAKVKAENSSKSHGQKTAQRQIAFEKEQQRKAEEFALDQKIKASEGLSKLLLFE